MKAQHLEMVMALREGRFDAVLEGRAIGGMDVLTELPNVDIRKLASQKRQRAETTQIAAPVDPISTQLPVASSKPKPAPPHAKVHFALHVLRSLSGGPERYDPPGTEANHRSRGHDHSGRRAFLRSARSQVELEGRPALARGPGRRQWGLLADPDSSRARARGRIRDRRSAAPDREKPGA
jgi:hypothetical protein